jgi:hypothetical protein
MTQRADARLAGSTYLLYIVFSMSSAILFAKATAGDDASQTLATIARMIGTARVTVLLDLLQPVCALVLAVTLYRLVKAVNPTLALLAMIFRAGEGLLGTFPILTKLELMHLATTPPVDPANTAGYLAAAKELLHRPDDGFSQFFFVGGGFLFACLFLRGRLIPRWLAWIGVVTIGAQVIFVPLHIATMVPGSFVNWGWMAILVYEMPLGIWLIVKGTSSSGLSPINAREEL